MRILLCLCLLVPLTGCQNREVPTTRWSRSASPGQPQASPLPESLRVREPGALVRRWGETRLVSQRLSIGPASVHHHADLPAREILYFR